MRTAALIFATIFSLTAYTLIKADLSKERGNIKHFPSSLLFSAPPPHLELASLTPKEHTNLPPITTHHFRCKGSHNNPIIHHIIDEKTKYFQDCDGLHTHSLPIIDGEETVYPHLVELLNYAQQKTKRPITILSGHRCYMHQSYLSCKHADLISLYQLGAAADVCFQGSHLNLLSLVSAISDWYSCAKNLSKTKFSINQDHTQWSNRYITLTLHEKTDLPSTAYQGPHLTIKLKKDPHSGKTITYSYRKVRNNILIY
ncbi:hypothetical protein COB21_04930 [Candidatus Aerophobetes bacterium]|uniref:Uncharacterized protein n=1 Tax=Aerophobetes bacterium TaxID=2030807 RepID=A0A2A4X0P0_UNCAE|nr:MAG: hypothetical protein COB21_04930 [Candidatus Aerophobetes bacterium]